MVQIFASASALLSSAFVTGIEPEKLASKFVKVEKEFGVKFTKTQNTFNIVGEWKAVRDAYKSLQQLGEHSLIDGSKKIEGTESETAETNQESQTFKGGSEQDSESKENHGSVSIQSVLRTKGNPKRGRYAKDGHEDSNLPEPVVFFQYQDLQFDDVERLNMDAVIDNYERSQINKKVTKDDLKKIFEKNTDRIGRPVPISSLLSTSLPPQKDIQSNENQTLSTNERNLPVEKNRLGVITSDQCLQYPSIDDNFTSWAPSDDSQFVIPSSSLAQSSMEPFSSESVRTELITTRNVLPTNSNSTMSEVNDFNGSTCGTIINSEAFLSFSSSSGNMTTAIEYSNQLSAPVITRPFSRLLSLNPMINSEFNSSVDLTMSLRESKSVKVIKSEVDSVATEVSDQDMHTFGGQQLSSYTPTVLISTDISIKEIDGNVSTLCDLNNPIGNSCKSSFDQTALPKKSILNSILPITGIEEKTVTIESLDKTVVIQDEEFCVTGGASGTDAKLPTSALTHEQIFTEYVESSRNQLKEDVSISIDITKVSPDCGIPSVPSEKPLKKPPGKPLSKTQAKKGGDKKNPHASKSKPKKSKKSSDDPQHVKGTRKKPEPLKKTATETPKLNAVTINDITPTIVKSDSNSSKKNKCNTTTANKDASKETVFKCTECDYEGKRKKRLTEHMGRVHGLLTDNCRGTQEKTIFPCDECDKIFVFGKDLNRHKKIVHHGKVHFCPICNKSYKAKYVFDKHMATHEEGYIQQMYSCQICDRTFTTKFSLGTHVKSEHLGLKKTFICPTCGKSFSQSRSYKQHANVHAGIRPYVCEICNKSFTYDKSLKEHRYMHDNVRRFPCLVCGKTFRQRTCLLIHMKVHKESKDHICSSCGKGFTQKQSLLRHERIHSGDKPYTCKLCSKSFGDYAVIRKHMMMTHKKDKDSWKEDIVAEERKQSSHYVTGGPGYIQRDGATRGSEEEKPVTENSYPTEKHSSSLNTIPSDESRGTLMPISYKTIITISSQSDPKLNISSRSVVSSLNEIMSASAMILHDPHHQQQQQQQQQTQTVKVYESRSEIQEYISSQCENMLTQESLSSMPFTTSGSNISLGCGMLPEDIIVANLTRQQQQQHFSKQQSNRQQYQQQLQTSSQQLQQQLQHSNPQPQLGQQQQPNQQLILNQHLLQQHNFQHHQHQQLHQTRPLLFQSESSSKTTNTLPSIATMATGQNTLGTPHLFQHQSAYVIKSEPFTTTAPITTTAAAQATTMASTDALMTNNASWNQGYASFYEGYPYSNFNNQSDS